MIKLNDPNLKPGEPEIIFPVRWTYRAVVDVMVPGALESLNKILEKYNYSERFAAGNSSSGKRYASFHVEVEVADRAMMNKLGKEFGEVAGVKFVL
jgi:putative lipoic acid-binding regulatory protein